jgi:agmatinase
MTDRSDPPQPSYVGSKTFMDAPETSPSELTDDVDVGVVGVPFDGAASRQPGTRFGPEALRRASGWYTGFSGNDGASYNAGTDRVVDFDAATVRDCGNAPVVTTDVEATGERVRETVRQVAESAFPVVLGGDHYLTYPSVRGVVDALGDRVGMVHLDAHSDVYGGTDLHGDHWHGSPMNLLAESGATAYENHAMVGLRAYEDADFRSFVDDSGLFVAAMPEVERRGFLACVEDAVDHASNGVDRVYLTVDIDVVDPAFAPGTGTPEAGGVAGGQLLRAMDRLGERPEIRAVDLVEVAPRLDPSRATHRLGACALSRFLEARFFSDSRR